MYGPGKRKESANTRGVLADPKTRPIKQQWFNSSNIFDWIDDVNALAKIAKSEPQPAYAAYVYGMSKRWAFLCRTTPNVSKQMRRLEHHISLTLLPAIIGKDHITDQSRLIFSMPAKYGGIGLLGYGCGLLK